MQSHLCEACGFDRVFYNVFTCFRLPSNLCFRENGNQHNNSRVGWCWQDGKFGNERCFFRRVVFTTCFVASTISTCCRLYWSVWRVFLKRCLVSLPNAFLQQSDSMVSLRFLRGCSLFCSVLCWKYDVWQNLLSLAVGKMDVNNCRVTFWDLGGQVGFACTLFFGVSSIAWYDYFRIAS